MNEHPLPWRVAYSQMCEQWDRRARPRVVDANGEDVCCFHQHVSHPGEYDSVADEMAHQIVKCVNATIERN